MTAVVHAEVTTDVVQAAVMVALVSGKDCGAIVTFSGDVRDNDHGRQVATLEYEAHPEAAAVLARVAQEVAQRHEIERIAVAHRHGPIAIGESALVAAVASRHRAAAFAACGDLVDSVKEHLPIWKHQVFTDGSDEWVNCA